MLIYANWVDTNADPEQFYFATAGSVIIENTTTGMKGSFSNLVFQHVTIDPDTFTSTVASSCQSSITSASYDEFYPEADCTNGMDDDQDMLTDCADDDCAGDPECMIPDAGVPDAAGPDAGVPDAALPDAMAS